MNADAVTRSMTPSNRVKTSNANSVPLTSTSVSAAHVSRRTGFS